MINLQVISLLDSITQEHNDDTDKFILRLSALEKEKRDILESCKKKEEELNQKCKFNDSREKELLRREIELAKKELAFRNMKKERRYR